MNKENESLNNKRTNIFNRIGNNIKLMKDLIVAYCHKEYREVPTKTIAMISFTVIYCLLPFDLISDFIPVVGLIEDLILVLLCFFSVKTDLN